jgi:hypothetical protein
MQFFLFEIVARIVAIYVCLDCTHKLRHGLVERKIAYFNPDLSRGNAHRDTAPVLYWLHIGVQISILVACLFVAIFGWRPPYT